MTRPTCRRDVRCGFTLVELLVTIGIIAILASMSLAGLGVMRNSARQTQATTLVQMLHVAARAYADSDLRHMLPDERMDRLIAYRATSGPAGELINLLEERAGYQPQMAQLDPPDASGVRFMHDGWGNPMHYQLDDWRAGRIDRDPDPVSTTPPVDLGPANRPLALDGWNPRGLRPYGYFWSRGKSNADDGRNWIYIHENP